MNTSDHHRAWLRLTAAARQASAPAPGSAPYGFAARVVRLAFAQPSPMPSLFERFAFKAVAVACLVALIGVAVNYRILTAGSGPAAVEDYGLPADDAIAVVLDLTD